MFFGIEWLTALIKISFEIVFSIVSAIPATITWNCIAPVYLTMIPKIYQHIPYWHIVSIFLVITYIGQLINRLVPKLVNVEQKVGK